MTRYNDSNFTLWHNLILIVLSVCINLSKSALRGLLFPSDIAKLGKKKPMEEYSSIGVKFLKVLRKVFRFRAIG